MVIITVITNGGSSDFVLNIVILASIVSYYIHFVTRLFETSQLPLGVCMYIGKGHQMSRSRICLHDQWINRDRYKLFSLLFLTIGDSEASTVCYDVNHTMTLFRFVNHQRNETKKKKIHEMLQIPRPSICNFLVLGKKRIRWNLLSFFGNIFVANDILSSD